jgi:hypothetical protein
MKGNPTWHSALLAMGLWTGVGAVQESDAPASRDTASIEDLLRRGLNDETYAPLRDDILPRPEELRWQAIPWRLTLREGLEEARKAGKPVLLWVMNGHPFACT